MFGSTCADRTILEMRPSPHDGVRFNPGYAVPNDHCLPQPQSGSLRQHTGLTLAQTLPAVRKNTNSGSRSDEDSLTRFGEYRRIASLEGLVSRPDSNSGAVIQSKYSGGAEAIRTSFG